MAAIDRGPEGRIIGHGYRNLENYRRRLLLGCDITWTTVPTRRIRGPTSVRRVEPLIEDHRNRAGDHRPTPQPSARLTSADGGQPPSSSDFFSRSD
jgi:hypothetical protein